MLKNSSIGKRIYLGFGVVIIILMALSTISYISFIKFNETNNMSRYTYEALLEINAMKESMMDMESAQRGFSITGDEKFLELYNMGKTDFELHYNKLRVLTSDEPEQLELLQEIRRHEQDWIEIAEKSIAVRRNTLKGIGSINDVIVQEQKNEGKNQMDEIRQHILESIDIERKLLDKRITSVTSVGENVKKTLIAGSLAAVIFAVFIAYYLTGQITGGIRKLTLAANKLSLGDVDIVIQSDSDDEIGTLMKSFEKMLENIRQQANVAQRLAKGELGLDINVKSDKDIVSIKQIEMIKAIKSLVDEMDMLTNAAIKGKLGTRGNSARFEGAYKQIVDGVNNTLDSIVGNLEAIPAIIQFVDKDLNIQYMNREGAKLLGKTKEQLSGVKCADVWYTDKCNTLECPCVRAMSENALVHTENIKKSGERSLDIYCSGVPLKDKNGNIIGAFEFVTDQTQIKQAIRKIEKISQYQSSQVSKLTESLKKLAQGNLNFDLEISEGDEDTHEAWKTFNSISLALKQSINVISGYIKDISDILTEMSKGNLDVNIEKNYIGDFKEVKSSLNLIVQSFNDILNDLNNTAELVAAGARQVSDSSQALSQGSTEQASSVEEITSSISEIAAQTKQNAENARKASELAMNGKNNAMDGNHKMKEMLKAIEDINQSSSSIYKIIKVIDEIAFQTNILALNAAVEAARAGQHGKGFAVVAEEVRNLAARSANAAKETTALIEGSINKVETGTKIANETAISLNSIVDSAAKASTMMEDIAQASNEQATGITQINQAISEVSQVTQTNSTTSEESASASEELASQAQALKDMVGKFKLKGKLVSTSQPFVWEGRENQNKKVTIRKTRISLDDNEFGKY